MQKGKTHRVSQRSRGLEYEAMLRTTSGEQENKNNSIALSEEKKFEIHKLADKIYASISNSYYTRAKEFTFSLFGRGTRKISFQKLTDMIMQDEKAGIYCMQFDDIRNLSYGNKKLVHVFVESSEKMAQAVLNNELLAATANKHGWTATHSAADLYPKLGIMILKSKKLRSLSTYNKKISAAQIAISKSKQAADYALDQKEIRETLDANGISFARYAVNWCDEPVEGKKISIQFH